MQFVSNRCKDLFKRKKYFGVIGTLKIGTQCVRVSAIWKFKNHMGNIACVASVSVGFGSIERPRNRIFGILPAWKMEREPKKEMLHSSPRNSLLANRTETFPSFLSSPSPPPSFTCSIHRPVILCSQTAQKRLLRRLWETWKRTLRERRTFAFCLRSFCVSLWT